MTERPSRAMEFSLKSGQSFEFLSKSRAPTKPGGSHSS